VDYACEDSYRTLLREAGLSDQRTEGVYRSKLSQAAIADFEAGLEKKVTDFLQQHPDGLVLALDEMSLYFQATLKRVWFPLGQSPTVRISPDRDHIHYDGVLNLSTGQEIALSLPALSTDNTLHFLDHVLTCLPTQPILRLLDRAPWHTATQVQHLLTTHPVLTLSSSPSLP
jgi:hypothetical protein